MNSRGGLLLLLSSVSWMQPKSKSVSNEVAVKDVRGGDGGTAVCPRALHM